MNYIDIILGLIILISALVGLKNGLITELASLAALVLGIWGAIKFSDVTTGLLINYFDLQSDYLNIISFIITFIVIVILVQIVASAVNKLFDAGTLGFVNKLGGMVFGVLRSVLFLSIVLIVFDKIDDEVNILSGKSKSGSRLYEPIRNVAPSFFPFIELWDSKQQPGENNDIKTT